MLLVLIQNTMKAYVRRGSDSAFHTMMQVHVALLPQKEILVSTEGRNGRVLGHMDRRVQEKKTFYRWR